MKDRYESPLASRYASDDMLHLFSPDMRFETWRRLWVSLAKVQHALGLPVTLVALLISVEPLIDMGRTALNVSGSMTAGTLTSQWLKQTDKAILESEDDAELAHR